MLIGRTSGPLPLRGMKKPRALALGEEYFTGGYVGSAHPAVAGSACSGSTGCGLFAVVAIIIVVVVVIVVVVRIIVI